MLSRTVPRKEPEGGFSLVELLVAIGIVLLLSAAISASLSRWIESARGIDCMSHLRQIGSAFTTFAGDNDGACMPTFVDKQESPDIVQRYPFTSYWHSPNPAGASGLGDSKAALKLSCCPANKKANQPYATNYNVMRASGGPWRSVLSIPQRSKTILMTDSSVGNTGGFLDVTVGLGFNRVSEGTHAGKINILWVDGHVTSAKKSDITSADLAKP